MAHASKPRYLPPHLRARLSTPTSTTSNVNSLLLPAGPGSGPHAIVPEVSPEQDGDAITPHWPNVLELQAEPEVLDWPTSATDAFTLAASQQQSCPHGALSSASKEKSAHQSSLPVKASSSQLPTPRSTRTPSQESRKSSVTTPKADLVAGLLHSKTGKKKPKKKHRASTPTRRAGPKLVSPAARVWLKNGEIPKGVKPKKQKVHADTRSRLSGWATQDDVDAEQQDQGCPWKVNQPPVLDWNRREPFKDDDPSKSVATWVIATESAREWDPRGCLLQDVIANSASTFADFQHELPAFAPSYWIPKDIDGQTSQFFWKMQLKSNPAADPIGELANANPWWTNSSSKPNNVYNLTFAAPHIAGIDPDETTEQKQARDRDRGSNHAIKLFTGQGSPAALHHARQPRIERRGYQDKSRDIFVREANKEDMRHVLVLYNYYVCHSNTVDEAEPLSLDKLVKRWSKLQSPMLLAYEHSYVVRDRKKKQETQVPEKIVGFAFMSNHPNRLPAYEHTRYMQVFTAPTYYRRGVATALMDKLNNELDGDIRSILISYLHDEVTAERLSWITKWLARYGFKNPVIIAHEAWKNDKCLSRAIFQKDVIEAKSTDSSDRW